MSSSQIQVPEAPSKTVQGIKINFKYDFSPNSLRVIVTPQPLIEQYGKHATPLFSIYTYLNADRDPELVPEHHLLNIKEEESKDGNMKADMFVNMSDDESSSFMKELISRTHKVSDFLIERGD